MARIPKALADEARARFLADVEAAVDMLVIADDGTLIAADALSCETSAIFVDAVLTRAVERRGLVIPPDDEPEPAEPEEPLVLVGGEGLFTTPDVVSSDAGAPEETTPSPRRAALRGMLEARCEAVGDAAATRCLEVDGGTAEASRLARMAAREAYRLQSPSEIMADLVQAGLVPLPADEALRKAVDRAKHSLGWLGNDKPDATPGTDGLGSLGMEADIDSLADLESLPRGCVRCPRCTVGVAEKGWRSCAECESNPSLPERARAMARMTGQGMALEVLRAEALERYESNRRRAKEQARRSR